MNNPANTLHRLAQARRDARQPDPDTEPDTTRRTATDALREFTRSESDPTTLVRRIRRNTPTDQEN